MDTAIKQQCKRCRGTKSVRGMGGLDKACPECKATGFVTLESSASTLNSDKAADIVPPTIVNVTPVDSTTLLSGVDRSPSMGVAPDVKEVIEAPKKPPEQELGEMSGYTPLMIEALMAEPRMKPDEWRRKYGAVVLDPLSQPKPGKQYLPDLQSRAKFRENVARMQKPKPRKHNTMATHDLAGKLEGIE